MVRVRLRAKAGVRFGLGAVVLCYVSAHARDEHGESDVILCRVVLCYVCVVLCYVMLAHKPAMSTASPMLCCVMLCYVVLC
jgi:hypothetical protein